jgi:hypothetical protein
MPKHEHSNKIRALLAVAVLALGSNAVLQSIDKGPNQHFNAAEQTAIKEATTAWDNVVVLHEGVKYRKAPITVDGNSADDLSTVAGIVGKGEVIRADSPVVYQDQDGLTWLGFGLSDKPVNAESNRIYWVNISELQKESTPRGSELVSMYGYQGDDQNASGYQTLVVSKDSKNILVGSIDGHGGPVAMGTRMTVHEFDQQIQTEGLYPISGKNPSV